MTPASNRTDGRRRVLWLASWHAVAAALWLAAWLHYPRRPHPDATAYWAELGAIVLLTVWIFSLLRVCRRHPGTRLGFAPFTLVYAIMWAWLSTTTDCAPWVDAFVVVLFLGAFIATLASLTKWADERAKAAETLTSGEAELQARTQSLEQANQDLKRAQRELALRNDQLAGFCHVARVCASSLNVDALAEKIVQAAVTLAGADFAAVYLSTEQGEFVLNAHRHASPAWLAHAEYLHGPDGALAQVANEGKPKAVVMPPTREDDELLAEPGAKTITLVPLLAPGRVEGVLLLGRAGEHHPSLDTDFWSSVGSHIGISLQNARLYWQAARAWEDLVAAQGQLIRAERFAARGELADGVAHDFNNVLACVLANCQLLLRECTDDQSKRRLELIEQAARDGADTVQRLQRFASTDSGDDRGPINLSLLLEDAAELTRHRWKDEAQAHGQHVAVHRDYDNLPNIEANPAELREVLINLILNAVDALPRGGSVTLRTRAEQDHVCAEVQDDGVGMSSEVAARAFEPFFTTKRGRGTGLGLAVAAAIVSRHGGDISIRTKPNAGTTVSVRLPLSASATRPEPEAGKPSELPPLTGHILLVEDEEGVREPICEALRQIGHTVVETASGQEAIQRLERERFDMVISDLGMPTVSGWEVVGVAKLRYPNIVTVLLTGWAQVLDPAEARKRGADFILAKPIDLRRLAAEVEERLRSARHAASSKED